MKRFIYLLIECVEFFEFLFVRFSDDDSDKILDSIDISTFGLEVHTDTGFVPLQYVHITKPYTIYSIATNNRKIYCADRHIFFDSNMEEVFADELKVGNYVATIDGIERIENIECYYTDVCMFDVTVDHKNHRLYENGYLCHQTTTSSIFIAWYLCFQYDKNAFFLANKGATTAEVVKKTKNVLQYLPFFLKPGVVSLNVYSMSFDNGCSLQAQTTTENSGIGFTIHLLYLDEFAHVPSNIVNSFWENVYPTLSSSKISRIIITSTPNGFNKFYDIYTEAMEKKNTFHPQRIDWWQVPGRDEKWRKQEVKNIGSEEAFNEQYGNQFYTASTILLDVGVLKSLREKSKEYKSAADYFSVFEYDNDVNSHIQYLHFDEDFDLENDIRTGYFVFSVDISEGDGGDYSVINIFKLEFYDDLEYVKNADSLFDYIRLRQVGVFRNNRTDIDILSKILYLLLIKVFNSNNCKLVLEYNTYGSDMIYRLQTVFGDLNDWDDEIFVKYKHKNDSHVQKIGLRLKSDNKTIICQEFKKLAKKMRVDFNESKTVEEAFYFGKTKGGYATTHKHDDLIMTCINASTIFGTMEFSDLAEEFIDSVDQNEVRRIEEHFGSSNISTTNFNIYDTLPVNYKTMKFDKGFDFDI